MAHFTLLLVSLGLMMGAAVPSPDPAHRDSHTQASMACIPDGGSEEYCIDLKLGDVDRISGAGYESDRFFDDPLGEVTISPVGKGVYHLCLTISNDGGELSGPNGIVQNEGGEGDCIEVYIKTTFGFQTTISATGPLGIGASITTATTDSSKSSSKMMCPC